MRVAPLLVLLGAGCATEGDVLRAGGDASADDAAAAGDGGDGDGDGGACPTTGPCPDPPAGDITVCGRVLDLETSAPVLAGAPVVRVFDFVELRLDPLGAVAHATVTPDACGWYTATVDGLAGIFVIHTGELPPATGAHRRVVEVFTSAPGQTVRANAWALRSGTDIAWSAAAGLGAETFADLGSLLAVFVDVGQPALAPLQGAPVAGAVITVNSQPSAADDFYFADATALIRATVAPGEAATGADGSGLLRDVPSLSQLGGQRAGCEFAEVNTLSIADTVQVQEIAGTCN